MRHPRARTLQDLLRRLTILEHNQRDILFLLRSLRLALHNVRVELSPETRRIHREIIRLEPFNGRCPCCLQTRVVSADGALIPPVEFDHFLGSVYSAPVHSWPICRPCHVALTNDRHLTWYPAACHAVPRLPGGRGSLHRRLRQAHPCQDLPWQERQMMPAVPTHAPEHGRFVG
jgi:hypothetical protein